MNEHNQGTLSVGKGGEVISDQPSIKQIPGCGDIEYYGGYLIAESVTPSNAARIVTCWNACKGVANPEKIGEMIAKAKHLLKVVDDKAGIPVDEDDYTELDFAANELADVIAILEDQS